MAQVVRTTDERGNVIVEDPPIARFLFSNTKAGWLWLFVRVWVGWQWLSSGEHKITDPAWVSTGEAVKGFWERALATTPAGKPIISFDWYRGFIQTLYDNQAWTWMAPIIAWSEVLIGIALIVGAFTGIAAFGGSLMNFSFVMAGTASTNMLLFGLAVLLILAWKVAGWYGLDRWLLPAVGTPWQTDRIRLRRPAADQMRT
jgi:thiosulfate dehydrogenase [quinone] large subunit